MIQLIVIRGILRLACYAMITLHRNRKGILPRLRFASRRVASGVLALLGAVWLNMAVQPCLMAAEPMLPDQHHESGCPHCPPAPDSHCSDEGPARCAFIDSLDFDGRQAPGHQGVDLDLAMAGPSLHETGWYTATESFIPRPGSAPPPPTGPPVFLRNCRFLK